MDDDTTDEWIVIIIGEWLEKLEDFVSLEVLKVKKTVEESERMTPVKVLNQKLPIWRQNLIVEKENQLVIADVLQETNEMSQRIEALEKAMTAAKKSEKEAQRLQEQNDLKLAELDQLHQHVDELMEEKEKSKYAWAKQAAELAQLKRQLQQKSKSEETARQRITDLERRLKEREETVEIQEEELAVYKRVKERELKNKLQAGIARETGEQEDIRDVYDKQKSALRRYNACKDKEILPLKEKLKEPQKRKSYLRHQRFSKTEQTVVVKNCSNRVPDTGHWKSCDELRKETKILAGRRRSFDTG